jgi:hypothetical protein
MKVLVESVGAYSGEDSDIVFVAEGDAPEANRRVTFAIRSASEGDALRHQLASADDGVVECQVDEGDVLQQIEVGWGK